MQSQEEIKRRTKDRLDVLRKTHKTGTHITVFPDGCMIPWRTLSLKEILFYTRFSNDGQHLPVVLEDEIFSSCVLDDVFRRRRDYLFAGRITSVAEHVWQYSTITSSDHLNQSLDQARHSIRNNNGVLHELVSHITLAFPYKPDEVYEMDLEHLLQIFALAEQKLLTLGMIEKPFHATLLDEEGQEEKQSPKEPRQDPKKVWEQIHGVPPQDTQTDSEKEAADERNAMALARKYSQMDQLGEHPFKPGEKQALLDRAQGKKSSPVAPWREKLNQLKQSQNPKKKSIFLSPEELPPEMLNDPKVSPIIKYGGSKDAKFVDFAMEELATIRSMRGHELQDLDVNRELMVRDARKLYAPVIKYLEERRGEQKKKSK